MKVIEVNSDRMLIDLGFPNPKSIFHIQEPA